MASKTARRNVNKTSGKASGRDPSVAKTSKGRKKPNRGRKTANRVDVDGVKDITTDEFINSEGGNPEFRKAIDDIGRKQGISIVVLEPGYFDGGVKRYGKKKDGYAVVYDFDMLTEAIAEEYMKHPFEENLTLEEAHTAAVEWIEVNTLRAIPYMGGSGVVPKVVYTDEKGKETPA